VTSLRQSRNWPLSRRGFIFLDVAMKFSQEDAPVRHRAHALSGDLSRLVANNPTRMTYHGTNTHLWRSGPPWIVIDPGPDDEVQTVDFMTATTAAIEAIVLPHHHSDHVGGAAALRATSGAPIAAFAGFASNLVIPDRRVEGGHTSH